MRPAQKKALAEELIKDYRISARRSCEVMMIHHSMYYYKHHRREDRPLRARIKEIAAARVRYGHSRIYSVLRREGWMDNHKRVYRVYREEGLNLKSKKPRCNRSAATRVERVDASELYQCCSMDFVSDALFDSRNSAA